MEMQGAASNDGRIIDGNYPAYADGVGKFTMTKRQRRPLGGNLAIERNLVIKKG
jgi:hypothetical protein